MREDRPFTSEHQQSPFQFPGRHTRTGVKKLGRGERGESKTCAVAVPLEEKNDAPVTQTALSVKKNDVNPIHPAPSVKPFCHPSTFWGTPQDPLRKRALAIHGRFH